MTRTPLKALITAVFVLALQACSSSDTILSPYSGQLHCTLVGCVDGFTVHLEPQSKVFPNGNYDLWIQRDMEAPAKCSLVINGAALNKSGACEGIFTYNTGNPNFTTIIGYQSDDKVSELNLSLLRNGVAVQDETIHPNYRWHYPNGEKCGGACRIADQTNIILNSL